MLEQLYATLQPVSADTVRKSCVCIGKEEGFLSSTPRFLTLSSPPFSFSSYLLVTYCLTPTSLLSPLLLLLLLSPSSLSQHRSTIAAFAPNFSATGLASDCIQLHLTLATSRGTLPKVQKYSAISAPSFHPLTAKSISRGESLGDLKFSLSH